MSVTTEHDERADLIATLLEFNRDARRTTRLDHLGRESTEYAALHECMNDMLTELLGGEGDG